MSKKSMIMMLARYPLKGGEAQPENGLKCRGNASGPERKRSLSLYNEARTSQTKDMFSVERAYSAVCKKRTAAGGSFLR